MQGLDRALYLMEDKVADLRGRGRLRPADRDGVAGARERVEFVDTLFQQFSLNMEALDVMEADKVDIVMEGVELLTESLSENPVLRSIQCDVHLILAHILGNYHPFLERNEISTVIERAVSDFSRARTGASAG